jgi:hypothetical protein
VWCIPLISIAPIIEVNAEPTKEPCQRNPEFIEPIIKPKIPNVTKKSLGVGWEFSECIIYSLLIRRITVANSFSWIKPPIV